MIQDALFSPAQDWHLPQARAADLCVSSPAVASDDSNATVLDLFGAHPDLTHLPVVENQRPIGMIKRHVFLSEMAKPFHRELYERKSCTAFMDSSPVIVDIATTIEDTAIAVVNSGGKALTDGFLIVRDDHFVGIGSGLDLMRTVANLQAEKNRQVMQSIDYASVIQRAMLRPSHDALKNSLADAALIWQPRDVVGGDFYQFSAYPDGWFLAIADCTGHGVPGAFMTLISSSWLARAVEQLGPHDPAQVLGELNRSVKLSLGQTDTHNVAGASDDGLDAVVLWFDRARSLLTFASARTPLYLLSNDAAEVSTIEGDRMGLGYVDTPMSYTWVNQRLVLKEGALVCAITDGLVDQIGGPKHIAFGKRRVREILRRARDLPATDLAAELLREHSIYQAGHRRRDDLTLFCLRA